MPIRVIATSAEETAAVRAALDEGKLAELLGPNVTAWQCTAGTRGEVAVGATPGTVGRHARQPGPAVPVP